MVIVTAGIIRKDNNILVARRKKGKHMEGYWEFPGGKIREGESPETCLKRELQEELGMEIKIGSYLMDSIYHYPEKTVCLKAYFAEYKSGTIQYNDHDQVEWTTIPELVHYRFAPADLPIVERLMEPDSPHNPIFL